MNRAILLTAVCLTSLCAWSAHALTEQEALEAAQSNTAFAHSLQAWQSEAGAAVEAAGGWPNPSIELARETTDLPGGSVEDRYYWLRQELDLLGRGKLAREAARARYQETRARIELRRSDLNAQLRKDFYETLAAQRQAENLDSLTQRMAQLAESLEQRVRVGDAAPYDSQRTLRELALLRSELRNREADYRAKRRRLASLIDDNIDTLDGELLPPPSTELPRSLSGHAALRALSAAAESARSEAAALRSERWPTFTIGIGRHEYEEPGLRANGNLIELGVEIPLFQRGQLEQVQVARAERKQAEREYQAGQLLAQTRAQLELFHQHRDNALALAEESRQGRSLIDTAEAAYRAGELSISELLDAHRSDFELRRRAVAEALAARLRYIQLQKLRGN